MEFVFGFALGILMILSSVWQNLSQEDLEIGLNKCQANGGLERYVVRVFDSNKVYCKDGAVFTLKDKE